MSIRKVGVERFRCVSIIACVVQIFTFLHASALLSVLLLVANDASVGSLLFVCIIFDVYSPIRDRSLCDISG